jgi:hypothetical protein
MNQDDDVKKTKTIANCAKLTSCLFVALSIVATTTVGAYMIGGGGGTAIPVDTTTGIIILVLGIVIFPVAIQCIVLCCVLPCIFRILSTGDNRTHPGYVVSRTPVAVSFLPITQIHPQIVLAKP